ncbi:DUF1775 domain-containing protein [bacterium]|nr:MAG: DUF1775 domain-containing protein [bacterium]
MKSIKLIIFGISIASLFMSPSAFAHVVVTPSEVVTAKYQTFSVSVPNEKEIPTTQLRLIVPDSLKSITVTVKPGWTITTEKDQTGATKSVTWSGGEIPAEQRDDFTFSTKSPDAASEIHWKAYQTYSDGSVVAWDAAATNHSHDDKNKAGPYSTTKVVTNTSGDIANQQIASAQSRAQTGTIIAIVSGVIALGAVFFATRTRER